MMALWQSYKSHLLTGSNFKQNMIAGLIVGIVALPLSMAFAIASGATPIAGIYTAIIAGFVVGIFGGTQVQISGPTGAFVVVLANITARHGFVGLQCTTLMAGILLLCLGFFKVGSMVKFIPYPVIIGFTTGIGFVIFIGQWKYFFGLPVTIAADVFIVEKLKLLIAAFAHAHQATVMLACISLATYLFSQHYLKKIPAPLVTLFVATGINLCLPNPEILTIGSVFGVFEQQLPSFHLPDFSSVSWTALIVPACTIALLGAIESLLSAIAIDAMVNSKHDSNQELIGQGMANVIAPFFGGFASTGAIARTIVNVRNGGNCPIAAVTHSLILLLILYFFAPYTAYIPLCALATILFVVAYNMSDLHQFFHVTLHAPWYDVVVLLVTCILTIAVDLVIAVIVGCMFAMILFFLRMIQTSSWPVRPYILAMLWTSPITQVVTTVCENNTIRFNIQGPFFFGVADKLEQAFLFTNTQPACIVFDFLKVPFIDITGLTIFYKIVQQYHQRGVKVYLEHVSDRVMKKMKMMHIDQFIEPENQ